MRARSTASEDIKLKSELTLGNVVSDKLLPITIQKENTQKDSCLLKSKDDDETWKAYLENPFTTAIMSMQGDEESATALGILYDYYKVPMEKRIVSNVEPNENNSYRYKENSNQCGSTLEAKCFHINEEVSEDNESLNENINQIAMCEHDQAIHSQHQYNAEDNFLSTSSYEPIDNLHCSTSLYENLSVAECVTSTTTNSSLFTSLNHLKSPAPSDYSGEFFEYVMEAPKSLKQKENEPTMSYINKGQYYCISLREVRGCAWKYKTTQVTSIVQIVFGDEKQEDEQLRNWKYWHARQHTARQRVIDIADYKECCSVNDVDEIAHNAISFSWDINDVAKIFISCNCLSTDFSAQKGIKGQPLLLQIDTFIGTNHTAEPIHRGICQLKVFCDKGAERKIRDEGRKATKKVQKNLTKVSIGDQLSTISHFPPLIDTFSKNLSQPNITSHTCPVLCSNSAKNANIKKLDLVYFKDAFNLSVAPVHFVPEIFANQRKNSSNLTPNSQTNEVGFFTGLVSSTTNGPDEDQTFLSNHLSLNIDNQFTGVKRSLSSICPDESACLVKKFAKTTAEYTDDMEKKKILLYVRKKNEEIFDGIFLCEPTLKGLKKALEGKYNLQSESISTILRKSKKGILVKLDDNIIRHYSDEDAFVMDVVSEKSENGINHVVTLTVL